MHIKDKNKWNKLKCNIHGQSIFVPEFDFTYLVYFENAYFARYMY